MTSFVSAKYDGNGNQATSPNAAVLAGGNGIGAIGSVDTAGVLRKFARTGITDVLLCSDSLSAFTESNITVTSLVNNNDGTATVSHTAHGVCVGQPVRTNVTANKETNLLDSYVVSVIDANNYKIAVTGRTHGVTGGGQPNIILPWRRGSRGWINWIESKLGTTFNYTWCSVGGAKADQILDILNNTKMSTVADLSIVLIGMNNIYDPTSTLAGTIAGVKSVIDAARARSTIQMILTVPPRDTSDAAWNAAKRAIHLGTNDFIKEYGRKTGAIVIDTWKCTQNGATYVNPAATQPDPDLSFMYDKTHMSGRGAQSWGYEAYNILAPFIGAPNPKVSHPYELSTEAGNLWTQADFSTATGGLATGTTLTGVTAGLTVTPTTVQRTINNDGDACGWNQVLTVNYATAAGIALFTWKKAAITGLVAGTTVQVRIPFKVTGSVGLCALEATISGTVAGTTWQAIFCELAGNAKGIPGTFEGYLIIPALVVPAGLSAPDVFVRGCVNNTQTTDMQVIFYHPQLKVLPV